MESSSGVLETEVLLFYWLRESLLSPWKNACWPWSALLDAHKVSVLSSLGSVFTPLPFKLPLYENYRRISNLCIFPFPQLFVALLKMIETSRGAGLTVWGLSVRQMKQLLEPSLAVPSLPSSGGVVLAGGSCPSQWTHRPVNGLLRYHLSEESRGSSCFAWCCSVDKVQETEFCIAVCGYTRKA